MTIANEIQDATTDLEELLMHQKNPPPATQSETTVAGQTLRVVFMWSLGQLLFLRVQFRHTLKTAHTHTSAHVHCTLALCPRRSTSCRFQSQKTVQHVLLGRSQCLKSFAVDDFVAMRTLGPAALRLRVVDRVELPAPRSNASTQSACAAGPRS